MSLWCWSVEAEQVHGRIGRLASLIGKEEPDLDPDPMSKLCRTGTVTI
jgi:hypothetical protein